MYYFNLQSTSAHSVNYSITFDKSRKIWTAL